MVLILAKDKYDNIFKEKIFIWRFVGNEKLFYIYMINISMKDN